MSDGRDLLAGESASGGGRDLLASPKIPASSAPTFPEKAEAAIYGLATSIPGMVGDIETMLPGGPEVGAKGKGALKGYETVFPTTQNIQSGLTKLGFSQPSESVKGYQTAGELAPAIVGGGKLIYNLGKAGARKIGSLIGGGKDLAAELQASTAGKTAEEIAAAEKRATTAKKRAGVAEQIAERESKKGEAAYEQLPGVSRITEAGVSKPIPVSADAIGMDIRTEANKVYDSLKSTREANAQKNKAEAFNFARQKEMGGAKAEDTQAYKDVMGEIDRLLKDKETGLAVATLDPIKNPLLTIRRALDPRYVDEATGIVRGKPVSFQGLEDLRRFLRDRSYGLPAEGFDAINQQRAGKLAESIEKVMSEFSDGRIDKFIAQYRKDSEPLRVFQTKVGKALVDEQLVGKGVNYANVPAQAIPAKAFKSPDEYYALVDALGGNQQLANVQAQRYFSGQMEAIKNAKDAENFIRKNRTMLKETDSIKMAEDYAIALRNAEKRGAGVVVKGEARVKTAEEQSKLKSDLEIIQSDIARADQITNAKEKIDYINKQAQKLANYLPLDQRNQFLTEVQGVVNAEQKKLAIKKWTAIALGGAGLYGTGHAVSGYLGK